MLDHTLSRKFFLLKRNIIDLSTSGVANPIDTCQSVQNCLKLMSKKKLQTTMRLTRNSNNNDRMMNIEHPVIQLNFHIVRHIPALKWIESFFEVFIRLK